MVIRAGRVALERCFNASYAHFWWPRRKDEEKDLYETLDHDSPSDAYQALVKGSTVQGSQSESEGSSKEVYILGAGNLGAFVAHSLAGIPNRPSITLLLKRRQLESFKELDSSLDVTSRKTTEVRRGFEVELLPVPLPNFTEPEVNQSMTSEPSNPAKADGGPLPPDIHQEQETLPADSNDVANILANTTPDSGKQESNSSLETSDELAVDESFPLQQPEENPLQFISHRSTSANEMEDIGRASRDTIFNLIVSVKAPQTVGALRAVAHRLTRKSTILFLQNGMGAIDEVNREIFPDERYRPTYIVGVVSHGLHSNRQFSVIHAGEGTIALGVMPSMPMTERTKPDNLSQIAPSARYLLRVMTRTPVLVAVGFPPTDLLQQQLDKLAVNCIINPLTAIFDCTNGALLSNFHFTRVTRLLLAEISLVIKNLPELKNVPNVAMRYDTARLEALVFSIANSTARNTSSMLQDLRLGKQTEIDYINGYIVKRGEEMGVHCVINYMLVHMIKGKRKTLQAKSETLPFA